MSNPSLVLRGGQAGPTFDPSTPGHVLAIDSDGKSIKPIPISSAGGLTSFNSRTAPAVVPTAGDYDASEVVNNSATVSGASSAAALDHLNVPFRARYYVDPSYTGLSTGSAPSPFKSVAAAFAYGLAQGITSGVVYLPNATTVTEDVVMPTIGMWELSCPNANTFPQTALLAGTVTITTTGSTFHSFTGLQITGAVSGNAGAQTRVLFRNTRMTSTLNLTSTPGQSLRVIFSAEGPGLTGVNGFVTGAVTIGGSIVVTRGMRFNALVTVSADSQFNGADLEAGFATNGAGLVTAQFLGCQFAAGQNFNALTGSMAVQLDGVSAAALMAGGLTTTGTVAVKTVTANGSSRSTIANNVAATTLSQRYPASMMEAQAVLTILTPGTTGNAVVNAIYTDMTGVVRTVPITTALDVTNAAGTAQRGTLPFEQNGATVIQYSVTGIVTPGPLSLSLAVAVRQLS